jgi:DNA repair protein RecO (recombination protein O)
VISECEGIVLRQTKALKGRRMILIFTDNFGKISAGTSISERGRGRTAVAVRPFTLGRYTIKHERGYNNIVSAEALKSHYSIGEDYDKYVNASLVLEFAGKIIPEDAPAPELYDMTVKFLDMTERRSGSYGTLTACWLTHALDFAGVLPGAGNFGSDELLSSLGFDKLEVLCYLMNNRIEAMGALALDKEIAGALIRTLLRFAQLHLDTGNLKSESMFTV